MEHPDFSHPWYVDDAGVGGKFADIRKQFERLQKSLQQEWQFLQRVTDGIGTEFAAVESSLKDDFLPALLGQNKVGQLLRDLLALLVKHAELALPNPTTSASRGNFMASKIVCGHLVVLLRERAMFNGAEHTSVISKEGRSAICISKVSVNGGELLCLLRNLPPEKRRIVEWSCRTRAWISVLPSTVNGMELSTEEFHDVTHLQYGQVPPNFPTECDDELGQLAGKALKPSAICDKPLINNGHKVERSSNAPTKADLSTTPLPSPVVRDNGDNQGGLKIHGFLSHGTNCIIDVRITDLDSKSYQTKSSDKVLAGQEQEKKCKYLAPCLAQ
eukprot:scaffold117077_cov65-Attheya_sp.AAC.6